MSDSEQQLFLIEFLVDRVNIPSVRAIYDEILPVTTCISFQILSLSPVNIEQEADSKDCVCKGGDSQIFNKGKSCLFALPTTVLEKPLHSFPITMSVYKKLPPGVLPDVMLIGTHQIQVKDLINRVLRKRIFKSSAPSETSKETYKITTATGQAVGEVIVFIRVSCFGKKIITQFQIPHNKKPFLFKGEQNSPVIQCKKIPSQIKCRDSKTPKCICKPDNLGSFGAGEDTRVCCPVPPPSPTSFGSSAMCGIPESQKPCYPSSNPSRSERYGFSGNSQMDSNGVYASHCQSRQGRIEQHNLQRSQYPCSPPMKTPDQRKCGCLDKKEKRCGCGWKA